MKIYLAMFLIVVSNVAYSDNDYSGYRKSVEGLSASDAYIAGAKTYLGLYKLGIKDACSYFAGMFGSNMRKNFITDFERVARENLNSGRISAEKYDYYVKLPTENKIYTVCLSMGVPPGANKDIPLDRSWVVSENIDTEKANIRMKWADGSIKNVEMQKEDGVWKLAQFP